MAKQKWPPKGYPLVDGHHVLTDDWSIELPAQFARRIDQGSLVLWNPELTLWFDAFGNSLRTSRSVRLRELRTKVPADATDVRESADPVVTRLSYRMRKAEADCLYTFVIADAGHLQIACYFDTADRAARAAEVVATVQFQG
jgi:hypothetical protein